MYICHMMISKSGNGQRKTVHLWERLFREIRKRCWKKKILGQEANKRVSHVFGVRAADQESSWAVLHSRKGSGWEGGRISHASQGSRCCSEWSLGDGGGEVISHLIQGTFWKEDTQDLLILWICIWERKVKDNSKLWTIARGWPLQMWHMKLSVDTVWRKITVSSHSAHSKENYLST